MGPPSCAALGAWAAVAIVLQISGLIIFVIGFFPVKPTLPGVSGPESYQFSICNSTASSDVGPMPPPHQLKSLYQELSGIPPSFDRLILMVIDGLPAEFVIGKGERPPTDEMRNAMPYTQSLLSKGMAVGFHSKAAPPTVTMPRLKAMMTGALGGFLDVAFNFNTKKLLEDNLLGQFESVGWKMVMFGDETWIKMFPDLFMRHDGVSSFFVKDTVEVDRNVSRHLDGQLALDDWNLMLLHYLGLDHVGHIGGRKSMLMVPKLKEMDEIIQNIHKHAILRDNCLDRTLLLIVSDHGMTNSGNHGGSSYEEMDSLALFVGLDFEPPNYALATQNHAFQVDIAPTLAVLFGIPIPKNSVGILMSRVLKSLTDEQSLRARELNTWQLAKLLEAQLPHLFCGASPCILPQSLPVEFQVCNELAEEHLCCSLRKALSLHEVWRFQSSAENVLSESLQLNRIIDLYDEFLRVASQWLSRRATEKPLHLLTLGIFLLLVSSIIFISLVVWLTRTGLPKLLLSQSSRNIGDIWSVDEAFILAGIIIQVLSMGASSMVEEEQYIWHFLTSSLFLLYLRKAFQCRQDDVLYHGIIDRIVILQQQPYIKKKREILHLLLVLVLVRLLRGWHQGGVNWRHLSDIATQLEISGKIWVNFFQIIAVFLITSLGMFSTYEAQVHNRRLLLAPGCLFISGILVILHVIASRDETSNTSTLIAQSVYVLLTVLMIGTPLSSPWLLPLQSQCYLKNQQRKSSVSENAQNHLIHGLMNTLNLIGKIYVVCWCLLQLLLQQPTNAGAVTLVYFVTVACINMLSMNLQHKPWVQVSTIYFLGLIGHFGLGNSNSLATIDVAGAFVGLSRHSTFLSGILLFLITYASPLLCHLILVSYHPLEDMKFLFEAETVKGLAHCMHAEISHHCLVPLALNSLMLTSYTVILLVMRNHLFIWSVFSPKFLYVCTATVGVYLGSSIVVVTKVYVCMVVYYRSKRWNAKLENCAKKVKKY